MEREILCEKLNTVDGVTSLLTLKDFSSVYREADRVRRDAVGDVIHLRAIIEFSNVCRRRCLYCGLNRENKALPRYRMSRDEIVSVAAEAVKAGYRTIVLQSGEDEYYTAERMGDIIADIKALMVGEAGSREVEAVDRAAEAIQKASMHEQAMPCEPAIDESDAVRQPAINESDAARQPLHPAITVSCGERPPETYRYWREKGADRYLLKHETADPMLYDRLHPCGTLDERVGCLKTLKQLGYETGSGFMTGLPGQTLKTIAEDLLLLKEIPCEMAGVGPFISNPKTPLAGAKNGDPELTRRAVAIARLLLPKANLPLTTALSILSGKEKDTAADIVSGGDGSDGSAHTPLPQENPFAFGANVIMKKVTPDKYKAAYEIYPAEFKTTNIIEDRRELEHIIRHFGRTPL